MYVEVRATCPHLSKFPFLLIVQFPALGGACLATCGGSLAEYPTRFVIIHSFFAHHGACSGDVTTHSDVLIYAHESKLAVELAHLAR